IVSQSLGRAVDFKDIDLKVSLEKGIKFHLSDFLIAENPDFGTGNFVRIKEIDAGVDIISFIISRRISFPSVLIRFPRVEVIRNNEGLLNVQTIGQPVKENAKPGQSSSVPPAILSAIFINSIKVENAELNFVDKSMVPALKLSVTQATLDVRRFSLTDPFDFLLDAAVLSLENNFHLGGKAQLKLSNNELRLKDTEIELGLSQLTLNELSGLFLLKNIPVPQVLGGQLKVKIKEAAVSDKGLDKLIANISLATGKVIISEIVPGVSLEANRLDFGVENFNLDGSIPAQVILKAAIFQDEPNLNFTGEASFNPRINEIHITRGQFTTDLELWPLQKIKTVVAPKGVPFPQVLSGKINAQINDATVSPKDVDFSDVSIQWLNGKIAISDIAPGISIAANNINLDIKNLLFDDVFDVTATLGLESDEPNVSLGGKMAVDLETQSVRLSRAVIKADLSKIPFERLKTTLAPLKDVPLPEILKGQVDINVKNLLAGPQGLNSVIADIVLKEGEVSMKEIAPGISFAASHIDADIKNFGLGTSFVFDLKLAYLSEEANIQAKGTATLQIENQTISLKGTVAQADLSKISMGRLKAAVAALKDVPLPERLNGTLNVDIASAIAGPKGLSALSGRGSLNNWEVKLKELAIPICGSDTSFKMTESLVYVNDLKAVLGKGQISAKVSIAEYMTSKNFDLSAEVKGIGLSEILDQKQSPVKVEGLVFGNIKAKGQAADVNSITGEGNFEIKESKLKDLNVLKTVLDKISFLPNVSSRVEAKLPEKYKTKLQDKDTEIKKISSPCIISKGVILLEPISVEADEFIFDGKCQAGFDQRYSLDGKVKIPAELSTAMGEGIEELKYLYDEKGNISLPVHVTGKGANVPVFAVTQTAIDMGKNAILNQGKKEVGQILNKALGIEENVPS
ncbi:MAG: DUF748 domain-containing protein, partial [Candidatus Omnitrophica bacterium]|nr:DUF748 domain-containing protein [Candidatus Omnitrophota bacterium]